MPTITTYIRTEKQLSVAILPPSKSHWLTGFLFMGLLMIGIQGTRVSAGFRTAQAEAHAMSGLCFLHFCLLVWCVTS